MSTQPVPQPDNFQYVKLPDGSYGKFSGDASDDVIKSAISKDFPTAFASQAPPDQSSAAMRFIKSAASRLYAGTAGAGPQQSGTISSPDAIEQAIQSNAGKGFMGGLSGLRNDTKSGGDQALDLVKQFNPIDVQKFQSGDTAGGLGSSLANLLMLRQAFKRVPTVGAPNAVPSVTPPQAQPLALQSGPIELGPSSAVAPTQEGVLPAARKVLNNGNVQYLTRPLRPGEAPDVAKNTNTLAQDYFIQKMRQSMEQPTVTGDAEQQAATQRMADYAKTPVDAAQATQGGPVEATPQYAYRSRDAGTTGIMPNANKTAQASLDPAKVQSYMPGRGQAQNAPQEMVRVDLSKLDPSEYTIQPNGYVNFKGPVPESFIEKMGSKSINDLQPRVPTSDADMQDLLMKSIQRVQAKARSAKAGD
jgi:hypothetical protein